MGEKNTTYTAITAKIITFILVVTLIISFVYGEYIKSSAIEKLAHADARKTSKILFESYYAAMAKGWTKDDLKTITKRLNKIDEKMSVNIYRSSLVAELYGEIEKDKEVRSENILVIDSLKGKEVLNIIDEKTIEYYFPVFAKNECLKCHANAKVGDVLGTIHVKYPVDEIKISLNKIIDFFMIFMVVFSLIMFLILFINFQRYMLYPMKNFILLINTIKDSKDIKKRATFTNNIHEIQSMQSVFNSMLDSLEDQFYNDSLTKTNNRISLIEDLETVNESLLMIINIDSFQEMNNLYGNAVGDELLVAFTEYLKEMLPKDDKLYRLHADEFAYLCSGHMDIKEFEELATHLISSIGKHKFDVVELKDIQLRITIGISYGLNLLLPQADIALKIAKKENKHQLTYNESMEEKHQSELNIGWAKRLNKAIEDEKIIALFQPIVDCSSGETVKYECLMRMIDDQDNYISPIHFLDIAKKNKVYSHLTKAILKDAFNIFKNSDFLFSVNLSVEDILDEEITSYIYEEIAKSNIGQRMVIEIVESEGIENFEHVSKFISAVKKHGVGISIDDFGTGYSNFEYLIELDVDYIKIDGSMIKNLDKDKSSRVVVQTIVEFAQRMDIKTVAEYVYSKEIYDLVKSLDVDYAQGYYFGQPTRNIVHSEN
ncbi:MAG: EAL domain-containing protein [Helicobacteraceae bacterium]|nr:EAL domain-containing protein [Helicobacteraceae bacterium]